MLSKRGSIVRTQGKGKANWGTEPQEVETKGKTVSWKMTSLETKTVWDSDQILYTLWRCKDIQEKRIFLLLERTWSLYEQWLSQNTSNQRPWDEHNLEVCEKGVQKEFYHAIKEMAAC